MKLNKYCVHASGQSLRRIINALSYHEKSSQAEIDRMIDKCITCRMNSRKINKKKTSIPKATGFNEVVCIDLKVNGDSAYILWAVDEATRFIWGKVIHNKKIETIIKALDDMWIHGPAAGPGMPARYFICNIGNSKFIALLQAYGICLRTTATYSPQMNGTNKRDHKTADIIVQKILYNDLDLFLQEAVYKAAFMKKPIINTPLGFSPFQLTEGRNPTILGHSEFLAGALENITGGEIAWKILQSQQQKRIKATQVNADNRLKIAMRDRVLK